MLVDRWSRAVFAAAALFLAVGESRCWAGTAREILDRAKELDDTTRNWTDRVQKMALVTERGGSERRRELQLYNKRYPGDERRSTSIFLAPAEVKGTAFLQWTHKSQDSEQWLYAPELGRTRTITARLRDEPFMASAFSYRDLDILGKLLEWTEAESPSRLVGDERLGQHDCFVIELKPTQADMPYGRLVLWMDKEQVMVRKIDFHDRNGDHVKTLTLDDFRDVASIPTPHRLDLRRLKDDVHTVVTISDVTYNVGLKDEVFSQRYIERGGL